MCSGSSRPMTKNKKHFFLKTLLVKQQPSKVLQRQAAEVRVLEGAEMSGRERKLTRADLPTPPEPNTTSLYSRMAGLLHRTANNLHWTNGGKSKIRTFQTAKKKKQTKKKQLTLFSSKTNDFFPCLTSEFSHSCKEGF